MTHSNFSGVSPLFAHPEHMLHLGQRIGIDAQIGRSAFNFLTRLFHTFQAISSKQSRTGHSDMGWNAGQFQILRVSNAKLSRDHNVTIRSVQRLLRKLHDAKLIELHQVDAYHREIDLSPLFHRAVEWRDQTNALRARQQTLQKVRIRAQHILARYSSILNALRSGYAEPAKTQAQVLEDITSLEALRLSYGECVNDDDVIEMETYFDDAERAAERLEAVLQTLREASVGMVPDPTTDENAAVEKDEAAVDNDDVFVSPTATKMSSPHDSIDTQYTHTTPHMRVNSIKRGDRAFTAAPRRARSTNTPFKQKQNKAGAGHGTPDSWSIAWGLALKLRPEWKRAMGACRTPEEYLEWIANYVPVHPRLLAAAMETHTAVDVLGAFVVAASRDATDILACHSNREERGRAIYAAGMLQKLPGGDDYDPDRPDQYLRPWPSVYGLLHSHGAAR